MTGFERYVSDIQAVSGLILALLTGVMVYATVHYARLSAASLRLAREQFEREWTPHVHVQVLPWEQGRAQLVVTNLGRASVLLLSYEMSARGILVQPLVLETPLRAGEAFKRDITRDITGTVRDQWDDIMSFRVRYVHLEQNLVSDDVHCSVRVEDGLIRHLDAIPVRALIETAKNAGVQI